MGIEKLYEQRNYFLKAQYTAPCSSELFPFPTPRELANIYTRFLRLLEREFESEVVLAQVNAEIRRLREHCERQPTNAHNAGTEVKIFELQYIEEILRKEY